MTIIEKDQQRKIKRLRDEINYLKKEMAYNSVISWSIILGLSFIVVVIAS